MLSLLLQLAALDCYVELAALQSLSTSTVAHEGSRFGLPAFILASAATPAACFQNAMLTRKSERLVSGDESYTTPWVAVSACPGLPLLAEDSTTTQIPAEVAKEIGAAVAAVHGASKGGGWFFKDERAWLDAVEAETLTWQSGGPWEPFLGFLQHRRQQIFGEVLSDARLPLHLLAQLNEYLPKVHSKHKLK